MIHNTLMPKEPVMTDFPLPILLRIAEQVADAAPAAAALVRGAAAGRPVDPDETAALPLAERELLVPALRWAQVMLPAVPPDAIDEVEREASRLAVYRLLAALSAVRVAEVVSLLAEPPAGRA